MKKMHVCPNCLHNHYKLCDLGWHLKCRDINRGFIGYKDNGVTKYYLIRENAAKTATYPSVPLSTKIGLTLIPALISDQMPGKVLDKITYPFSNLNGVAVEV